MPNLPESLLALVAGRTRAAAIMGDLTEMATTRGRLWFFAAYARTLFSLTWRIVLALFIADLGREFIFNLANLYFHVTPPTWRTTNGPYLLSHMGPFFACILSTLWFVLPFAAVRYGLRDRFVRLTFAVALGTTVAFLFIPWASFTFAAATLALAAATLLSKTWRKPLGILIATGITGVLAIALINGLGIHQRHHPGSRALAGYLSMLSFQTGLLTLAFLCSRLHRRLLEPPAAQDCTLV